MTRDYRSQAHTGVNKWWGLNNADLKETRDYSRQDSSFQLNRGTIIQRWAPKYTK